MLAAHVATSGAKWYVQLVAVTVIGTIVYLPTLLVFGLTPKEKVALRNGVAKLRAR